MNNDQAEKELEDALYGLITDLTGLKIRMRNSSPQKINEQYIQLHISEFEDIGFYHEGEPDDNQNQTTVKEYRALVDIACHAGERTSAVLRKIIHTLSSDSGLYYKYFDKGEISFLRASSVTRRDWPLDMVQWEERSQTTVAFSMVMTMADEHDIGHFDTVELVSIKTKTTENNVANDDTLTIQHP